jgi:hypothetical protein
VGVEGGVGSGEIAGVVVIETGAGVELRAGAVMIGSDTVAFDFRNGFPQEKQ